MDLFGFDDNNRKNLIDYENENRILIDLAIRKYRRSMMGLLVIFAMIIIVLNILIVPFIFEARLEERIAEIDTNFARSRNLPNNYSMVGVEVGAETINSVLEITSTSSTSKSSGSGFVINNQGFIITNAHVITYKRGGLITTTSVYPTIRCNFYSDTTTYALDVIHYDTLLDLAILKFRNVPSNLSPVIIGNSTNLNMGEEVVAIGNAQGLGLALTVGVVSDPLKTFTDGTNAIQTDAAINPGNSGGPLFNIYSELVGVTTFKIIDTEANEGMGFAIPSTEVINFIETTKSVRRIGINYTLSENYTI